MKLKTFFEDLEINRVGTLPHRSYYIPFSEVFEAKESHSKLDSKLLVN